MIMFSFAILDIDVLVRYDEGLASRLAGTDPSVKLLPIVILVESVALVQKELLAVFHSYKLGWKDSTKRLMFESFFFLGGFI